MKELVILLLILTGHNKAENEEDEELLMNIPKYKHLPGTGVTYQFLGTLSADRSYIPLTLVMNITQDLNERRLKKQINVRDVCTTLKLMEIKEKIRHQEALRSTDLDDATKRYLRHRNSQFSLYVEAICIHANQHHEKMRFLQESIRVEIRELTNDIERILHIYEEPEREFTVHIPRRYVDRVKKKTARLLGYRVREEPIDERTQKRRVNGTQISDALKNGNRTKREIALGTAIGTMAIAYGPVVSTYNLVSLKRVENALKLYNELTETRFNKLITAHNSLTSAVKLRGLQLDEAFDTLDKMYRNLRNLSQAVELQYESISIMAKVEMDRIWQVQKLLEWMHRKQVHQYHLQMVELQTILTEVQEKRKMLIDLAGNKLTPELLSLDKAKELQDQLNNLLQTKAKEHKLKHDDIMNIYKLPVVGAFINRTRLLVFINIPIMREETVFRLYKAIPYGIPLPNHPDNVVTKVNFGQNNILAITESSNTHFAMKETSLARCQYNSKMQNYQCNQNFLIQGFRAKSCIYSIFKEDEASAVNFCQQDVTVIDNQSIVVHQVDNTEFYVSTPQNIVNIDCIDKPIDSIKMQRAGLIEVPCGCKMLLDQDYEYRPSLREECLGTDGTQYPKVRYNINILALRTVMSDYENLGFNETSIQGPVVIPDFPIKLNLDLQSKQVEQNREIKTTLRNLYKQSQIHGKDLGLSPEAWQTMQKSKLDILLERREVKLLISFLVMTSVLVVIISVVCYCKRKPIQDALTVTMTKLTGFDTGVQALINTTDPIVQEYRSQSTTTADLYIANMQGICVVIGIILVHVVLIWVICVCMHKHQRQLRLQRLLAKISKKGHEMEEVNVQN